jgi:hypothetical protein
VAAEIGFGSAARAVRIAALDEHGALQRRHVDGDPHVVGSLPTGDEGAVATAVALSNTSDGEPPVSRRNISLTRANSSALGENCGGSSATRFGVKSNVGSVAGSRSRTSTSDRNARMQVWVAEDTMRHQIAAIRRVTEESVEARAPLRAA